MGKQLRSGILERFAAKLIGLNRSYYVPYIPVDIIIDILLRLPVISLLRLKFVCWTWKNIISSPSFVHKHLMYHRARTSTSDFSDSLELFWRSSSFLTYHIARNWLCPKHWDEILGGHRLAQRRIRSLIGPCHGVLLVFHHYSPFQYPTAKDELALWNPATRKIKLLPPPPADIRVWDGWSPVGLGVDPLAPGIGFKIVLTRHDRSYFPVYNSSTRLWKLVEDPILIDSGFEFNGAGIYSNGFIYWLLFNDRTLEYLLLAMDLRNDSFLEVNLPSTRLLGVTPQDDFLIPRIGLYNDSLALVRRLEGNILPDTTILVDLWLMEEPGCWTKLTKKSLVFELGTVGFWSRSKIYIQKEENNTVTIYDIDSGNTTESEFDEAVEYLKAHSDPFPYQPSLVSI